MCFKLTTWRFSKKNNVWSDACSKEYIEDSLEDLVNFLFLNFKEDSRSVLAVIRSSICLQMLVLILITLKKAHLVWKNSSQIVHCWNSFLCLMLGRQAFHKFRLRWKLVLPCGWWLAHKSGSIWREAICIQLWKVYRGVLTRTGEDNGCEKVAHLLAVRKGMWNTMVCVSGSDRISIVV